MPSDSAQNWPDFVRSDVDPGRTAGQVTVWRHLQRPSGRDDLRPTSDERRAARDGERREAPDYFSAMRVAFRKIAMSVTDVGMNGRRTFGWPLTLVMVCTFDELAGEFVATRRSAGNDASLDGSVVLGRQSWSMSSFETSTAGPGCSTARMLLCAMIPSLQDDFECAGFARAS